VKGFEMKALSLPLICLLVCWPLWAQSRPIPRKPTYLLLAHVTIIDSTGSAARPDMSVLIEGGKIKSISPTGRNNHSDDTLFVDARGKFLIARLWDMHAHALSKDEPDRFFPLFIANGVTGIRDMGGDIPLPQIVRLKKEVYTGSRLGPEIFAAGPILEGEHPFWRFAIPVKNADEARPAVTQLVKEGADFLKVYNTLSRSAYLAIENRICSLDGRDAWRYTGNRGGNHENRSDRRQWIHRVKARTQVARAREVEGFIND
jgi:hypothetical protein